MESNISAPFVKPFVEQHIVPETQFDMDKINLFNEHINVCSNCEKCEQKNNIPYCFEIDLPLAVVANQNHCPIGKW